MIDEAAGIMMQHSSSAEAMTSPTSSSVPNLNAKSPHNKRRGLSETPEIQRKSRKLFARNKDFDKMADETRWRKRSLTNPRSSVDESGSSRKSSVASSGKKRLFHSHGGGGGSSSSSTNNTKAGGDGGRQFAVTLMVSENDKTKIMDMLTKAKNVISRKVEKVMGKKPPKSTISSADALRTVLENWVDDAESKEKEDSEVEEDMIRAQAEQVERLRGAGFLPPVHMQIPTTVVSPVPEENEDIEEDEDLDEEEEEADHDDIEVQEIVDGQTNFLLPPKATKFRLERSVTPVSPTRSLSPCEGVPRPPFLSRSSVEDNYPLRRPSSHYDANAQAASSRPTSRVGPGGGVTPSLVGGLAGSTTTPTTAATATSSSSGFFDFEAFARAKVQPKIDEIDLGDYADDNDDELSQKIQRPASMIIPVGGVWRPGDSDEEVDFFQDAKPTSPRPPPPPGSASIRSPTPSTSASTNKRVYRVPFSNFLVVVFAF